MSWKDDKNKELFEGIKDDLIIYLKKGYFSSNSFINKLNLNVTNLEELIKLHFIFNESVVKFVDNLPSRIRNIKTSVEKKENLYKDVRGQIDWNQTINYRAKNNYLDQTNFICISNDRTYNITENIVLKRVLTVIDEILIDNHSILNNDGLWSEKWRRKSTLSKKFYSIFEKNIYMKRIKLEGVSITKRMISNTKKDRNAIYREAAEILETYRKILHPNEWDEKTELKMIEIFEKTLIQPENENVLFELYAVIKLIKKYADNPTYYIMDGKTNLVASWSNNEDTFEIYHDSTGPKEISFKVYQIEISESKNDYLIKRNQILDTYNHILMSNNKTEKNTVCDGRPDIILVTRNQRDQITHIQLGEVKYSNDDTYILKGLYELIEYLHLIKINDNFGDYSSNISGVLFAANEKFNEWEIEEMSIKYTCL